MGRWGDGTIGGDWGMNPSVSRLMASSPLLPLSPPRVSASPSPRPSSLPPSPRSLPPDDSFRARVTPLVVDEIPAGETQVG
jgi:hypothetical protein